mmetsp:Transcript_122462/g.305794  ORF Transcript_122462/g.305794 Transcript_122462/m.305794 type:complete len:222 (+) Transcript_122462:245-910(+)
MMPILYLGAPRPGIAQSDSRKYPSAMRIDGAFSDVGCQGNEWHTTGSGWLRTKLALPSAVRLYGKRCEAHQGRTSQEGIDALGEPRRVEVEENASIDHGGPRQDDEGAATRADEANDIRHLLVPDGDAHAAHDHQCHDERVQLLKARTLPSLRQEPEDARGTRGEVDRSSEAHHHPIDAAHHEDHQIVVAVVQNKVLLGEPTERKVAAQAHQGVEDELDAN